MRDFSKQLNPRQLQAVTHTKGPALVLAGAGSGKTRALTFRIAYLVGKKNVSPSSILAVTFTNKAAKEMAQRVAKLLQSKVPLPWLGTFHAICLKILRYELNKTTLPYRSNFVIYDSQDQLALIKRCYKSLSLDPKKFPPRAVAHHISSAKNELIYPKQYRQYANDFFLKQVASVYQLYQKELAKANALDFDDLIALTVRTLRSNPMILGKYQERFRYILVDEYQDTNRSQYELIKLLAKKHSNIWVCGDDYQAIFGWRGANFHNILNFQKDWQKTKVVKLEQNYRSVQSILKAADGVIKKNNLRTNKKIWSDKGEGNKVIVLEHDSGKDEAMFVVLEARALLRDKMPCVVLYRTHSQSRLIEEACLASKLNYQIIGGIRFYERKEIKDILAYLKFLQNPQDKVSLERIINIPPRGIGKKTMEKLYLKGEQLPAKVKEFYRQFQSLRKYLDIYPPGKLLEKILAFTGYQKWLDDGTLESETRLENIKELITSANSYKTLADFLEQVALAQDTDRLSGKEQLTLMTLHNAKGLEFDCVFIVGMEEGIFPHARSQDDAQELEEERRLCYVGMTRAKEKLYLSYAKSRVVWGGVKENLPSRFISEIPAEVLERL